MENELEIVFSWENTVGFKVTVKSGDDTVTILEAEENGEIASLWKHYQKAIESFISIQLVKIGQEMAQE